MSERADTILIRRADERDLSAINAIFNHYVAGSTCVWTTTPCTEVERRAWFAECGPTMPVLVAESAGRVVGWGSLGSFRPAYTAAGTVEDSVYVHHEFHRQGIGSRLLAALIDAARICGFRSVLANISADQAPSIRLHEKFGFRQVAHLRQVGRKFDRWMDAAYFQLLLTPENATSGSWCCDPRKGAVRPMTAAEAAARLAIVQKAEHLKESGVCPTCRDMATHDVYPPAADRTFYEDDTVACLLELYPRSPGHTIVLVKPHCEDLTDMPGDVSQRAWPIVHRAARALKSVLGAEKVYLCSMCDGRRNHFHLQLIPRLAGDDLQGSRVFVKERGMLTNRLPLLEELRAEMSDTDMLARPESPPAGPGG
jgi:L-amino acid N-acyltransferase YncA/diadenosine tetraphosphate (Ap4A) HIT family hydrolase